MIRFSPVKRLRHLTLRLGFAVLAVIGSHEAAVALPVDANVNGVWGPLKDWPLIAIHSILLRDGRVLTYGTDRFGQATGRFIYDVWDPVSDEHEELENFFTATDIFCSAHVLLPGSNSVLIAGGSLYQDNKVVNKGNSDANVFFGDSGEYGELLPDGSGMKRKRWYATTTTLANGKTYVQGGRGTGSVATAGGIYPEVRNVLGQYTLLSNINTSTLSYFYPRNYVAPNGGVFGYDVYGYTYFLSSDLGSIAFTGRLPNRGGNRSRSATSVMYAPGMILNFGGPSASSNVIDIRNVTPTVPPTVTPSGPLATARHWPNGTLLPNGRVLATGGSTVDTSSSGASAAGAELRAEIWSPATGKWAVKASGAVPRLYHSTALLLPDARVLVAGGGANGGAGPINNLNAQIYSPPYLFGAGGVYATRPVITSAPGAISPGQPFSVGVSAASIAKRVTVVKTGAVTHAFNMDQRFVGFPFTRAGNTLTVTAHPNPAVLTPGAYMLFVLGDQDVPSIAAIISVKIVVP